jgi:heme/copper-type cytochrome/quinol oxidase subunit 2
MLIFINMNLLKRVNNIPDLYKKYEVYISVVTFSFGLITTFLTLTRVDMFIENLWIIINLLLVGFGIFILTFFENKVTQKANLERFHFYLTMIIQFAFGGLFATYFVFYIRSSSFAQSWLFILVLLILLVGNEIWKKHYTRLVFQISALYLAVFLFLVFLLPVLFHRLGADLFIASGILGLGIIFIFTFLLQKVAHEKFKSSHHSLKISLLSIFVLMNIMYFTNIIPPIPLTLKSTGVYHNLLKTTDPVSKALVYQVKSEEKHWTDYFSKYPVFHKQAGEKVYVFSSIFSPVKFETNIIHEWQYYDEVKKDWLDSARIVIPIIGGRASGFRNYSFKQAITPGLWRVRVMTPGGQVLGNINFKIIEVKEAPKLLESDL